MYEIEITDPIIYTGQRKQQRPLSTLVLVFAIFYWLSPVDALPLLPPDDIIVMVLALWYSGMFSGE